MLYNRVDLMSNLLYAIGKLVCHLSTELHIFVRAVIHIDSMWFDLVSSIAMLIVIIITSNH